jgi:resolvase-like protein
MKKPATTTRCNGTVRCAIYTRKSSEEGLEQEFNSLQAQREACEAFIGSQRQEGWVCLRAAYDDGGFSGARMDRPALQRLLAGFEPSVPRPIFNGFEASSNWSRSILGVAALPSSCGLTNRSGPRAVIRGAAAYAESGGATKGGGALGDTSASRNRRFESRRQFRRDPTDALFADQSQSILDNLVAPLRRSRA